MPGGKQMIQLFALPFMGPDGQEKTQLYADRHSAYYAATQLEFAARIVEIEL